MNILVVGDIIGEPGRIVLKKALSEIIRDEKIDFVVANGENSAGGKGLTSSVAEEIFSSGVNVVTLGNHTWARREIEKIINDDRILRPANYPPDVPGKGWNIYKVKDFKIAVINLMGRVYMPLLDCPFRVMDEVLNKVISQTNIVVVDFHAEITSEKQAMGWYLDGKVSSVIGTHTHVQTADEKILPRGTAYITDCGMCGSDNGIIGMEKELVLKKYLTGIPCRFNVAQDNLMFNGCKVEIDNVTGKSISIKKIMKHL